MRSTVSRSEDTAYLRERHSVAPGLSASESPLSEDLRSHVWDIEHLGFVIEATVFSKLKVELNNSRTDFWKSLLSNECEVFLPRADVEWQTVAAGTGKFSRVEFAANDLESGGNSEFCAWLDRHRAEFSSCRTSLGLVRLIPDEPTLNGMWSSQWRLRMAGQDSGRPLEKEFEIELRLTQLHDDIAMEKEWITTLKLKSHSVFSSDAPYFKEITSNTGLQVNARHDNWLREDFVPNTGGMYVTDYDGDGNQDVFVDDHQDGGRLYRGTGDGTFSDVTETCGIDREGSETLWIASCWADFDSDGDDDLIYESRIYENLGNGSFTEVTAKSNLPLTPAVGYAVGDYDNDGKIDLYVCHTGAFRVGQQERKKVSWIDDGLGIDNVLYRNEGDWNFRDVTVETGTGGNGTSCFAAVWLHANDDDFIDLFAISEFGRNSLLLNSEAGVFTETDVDQIFGGFSMGVASGDYDNDGRTDIYVANMYSKAGNRILANVDRDRYPEDLYRKVQEGTRGSKLYRRESEGFQTVPEDDMVAHVGWAYGPTFADIDNDGWLDIYATAGFKSEERGKPDG